MTTPFIFYQKKCVTRPIDDNSKRVCVYQLQNLPFLGHHTPFLKFAREGVGTPFNKFAKMNQKNENQHFYIIKNKKVEKTEGKVIVFLRICP